MKSYENYYIPVVILTLLYGSATAQPFTKITTSPFSNDIGDSSGASWIDYDGDGDLDLFVSNRNSANYLYRNNGDGSFAKASAGSLTSNRSTGSSWADIDNDGDLDVFTAGDNSYLYQNNGNGSFSEVTNSLLGLSPAQMPAWACAWADYDLDGWIDLVITHPIGFIGNSSAPNFLFRNKGDGTFERITSTPITSGLFTYTVPTWSDYDMDGDPDLFIGSGPANGTQRADFLYKNMLKETGEATFQSLNQPPLSNTPLDGQVWNWIDYDNDRDLDAFVTNFWGGIGSGMRDVLFKNNDGQFSTVASISPVTDPGFSLANVWGDFDNDKDLDLFISNDANNGAANRFYQNNGDGSFSRFNVAPFSTDIAPTWGATAGDFDNDGDLDLFVPNILRPGQSPPNHLYRNDLDNNNNWLKIKLIGVISNRSAIGAKVWVKTPLREQHFWQVREISAQNTFCGQNSLEAHFGLSIATSVDSITIEWPSGIVQSLSDINPNQTLIIEEDISSSTFNTSSGNGGFILEQNYPNPFRDETNFRFFLPYSAQVSLNIIRSNGTIIRLLKQKQLLSGWQDISYKNNSLAPGIYFIHFQTDKLSIFRPIIKYK